MKTIPKNEIDIVPATAGPNLPLRFNFASHTPITLGFRLRGNHEVQLALPTSLDALMTIPRRQREKPFMRSPWPDVAAVSGLAHQML
jgi:hypothetical protein